MKKVIVIVGPTASGKTKNSISIAKHFNGQIINGDSVQVYKELNIGSAKIKDEEMLGIKHHLLDVVSVGEDYSVYNFQKDARKLIDEIDLPLIVGGTGFYIKAALYDYEFLNLNTNNNQFEELSNIELYNKLLEIDSNIQIDQNNRIRLVSAYNQALSGNLRSEKVNKNVPLYDILTIYLDIDRSYLKEILKTRLDTMFAEGIIEETKYLRSENIKLNTIGYREIDQYLDGLISLEEAKELIIRASVKLAKRQKTWFLNQMNAISVNPLDDDVTSQIIKITTDFIEK